MPLDVWCRRVVHGGFGCGVKMRLVNFRDLGGLALVSGGTFPCGRLFRSGTFSLLTPGETEELVSSLGLATLIDLRTGSERQRSHQRFPDRVEVFEFRFLTEIDPEWERPSGQSPPAIADRYLDMLERQGREALPSIISTIARDRLPMVIHCASGKDRTGIVIGLVLALAGVTDEAIADDYARSGPALKRLADDPANAGVFAPDPPSEYETSPETMRMFLDGVRSRYGSIEELAITSNVAADDLHQAQAALLAPQ